MGLLDITEKWTFAGLQFARKIDTPERAPWFRTKTIHTIEPILEGGRWTDIGGDDYDPITITAVFESAANRTAFKSKRKTTATLANVSGNSAQATLLETEEMNTNYGLYYLICVFELA